MKKASKINALNIVKWALIASIYCIALAFLLKQSNLQIMILGFLTILGSVFVAIATHEVLGHALVGWLVKYKCYEIQVLFLKIDFHNNKRISFILPNKSSLGHSLSLPQRRNLDLKCHFLYFLAGPVASLLLCFMVGLFVIGNESSLLNLAFISILIISAFSIVPISSQKIGYTDTAMAISALRQGVHATFHLRMSYIHHLDQQRISPRDIPLDLLLFNTTGLKGIYRHWYLETCILYCLDARQKGQTYSSSVKKIEAIIQENHDFLFSQKYGLYLPYLITIGDEASAHAYYDIHRDNFEKAKVKEPSYSNQTVYCKKYFNQYSDEAKIYWDEKISKFETESGTELFLKKFWNKILFEETEQDKKTIIAKNVQL